MIVYMYAVISINHQYDLDIMTHPPTQFKHYTALRNIENINNILRFTLFYNLFLYSLRPFGPPLIAGPRCRLKFTAAALRASAGAGPLSRPCASGPLSPAQSGSLFAAWRFASLSICGSVFLPGSPPPCLGLPASARCSGRPAAPTGHPDVRSGSCGLPLGRSSSAFGFPSLSPLRHCRCCGG